MFLYIEGPLGSGKTEKLLEIAKTLVTDNASSSMLVLCSNHARQKYFLDSLLNQLDTPLGALPVYTFSGFVRNTLFNYWPLVETTIGKVIHTGPACLTPQLSGMEDSELILNQIYEWLLSRNPQLFAEFPGTSRSLMKQIIRRLRLRAENLLPRDEMTRRSTELQEICIDDMAAIEKWFDRISYTLRVLDPNKQMEVFHQLLQQAPLLQDDLRQQVEHLLVDDVDETIPAQQAFIRWISPSLKSLVLTADLDGGSRRGYLNAYPYDWQLLKSLRPGETVSLQREDRVFQDAQVLLNNWKLPEEAYPFQCLGSSLTLAPTCMTQVEMMDLLLEDIGHQLEKGYSPGDIALVLPEANPLFFYRIQNKLQQRGIRVQLLSGTKRPLDHPLCRGMIYLLQLANQGAWESPLSPIELRTIFTHILQFDVWSQLGMEALLQAIFIHQSKGVLQLDNPLPEPESLMISLPESLTLPPELFQRYCLLYDWLSTASQKPFETQILSAFQKIIAPFCGNETQRFLELNQWLESYTRQKWIHETLQSEGLLSGSLEQKLPGTFAQRWIALVKSGSVADSPETPEAIDENAILLGSPQKIIDFEVSRKIQYWVDISSREWARSDNAPLYNAWVHSAVWDGSQSAFSEEFKEALIRTRAAHITRTLYLLAQEQVRAFSSELDHEGFNQTGLLQSRLLAQGGETVLDHTPEAPIFLRPDQEPVMAYTEGTMAITAVPGAGKTFINVELILKLIDSGSDPTEILVLTYMDSAAKTLLSRIKTKMSKRKFAFPSHRLPTVSTIHSLAFRILTENDNSLTMGFLPEDVEILDEFKKEELLASVAFDTEAQACDAFGQQMGNDWLQIVKKGIGQLKSKGISPLKLKQLMKKGGKSFRLNAFYPAYQEYVGRLNQQGAMDFDDLILNAISLLETQPQIREKYQAQYRYIIEDEAQDSSLMLQRFIQLLGGEGQGKKANLIRTGDPNQSITTTFSSADPTVFLNFIQRADLVVEMNSSARCAAPILGLANEWIQQCEGHPVLRGAFHAVEIQPVPSQNPALIFPLEAKVFEQDRDEEAWMCETIHQIRQGTYLKQQDSLASSGIPTDNALNQKPLKIAVLLRRNEDVTLVTQGLQQAGIPAISLSESLNINPVFNLLLSYLQLLEDPKDAERRLKVYEGMLALELVEDTPERRQFITEENFFYARPGGIEDGFLLQWYYDWLDFNRDATGSNLVTLLIRMTDRLFQSVPDRSNGYLCALWAKEILHQNQALGQLSPLEILIQQFQGFQNSRRKKPGFSEVLNQDTQFFVQVMSLHKSKGQEFDVVFIPRIQTPYFRDKLEDIRFKEPERLAQELEKLLSGGVLAENYADELKKQMIHEEARLFYVGLTRAQRALFLSAHTQGVQYGKLRKAEPAWAFWKTHQTLHPPPSCQEFDQQEMNNMNVLNGSTPGASQPIESQGAGGHG